jgi:hypothetical protein
VRLRARNIMLIGILSDRAIRGNLWRQKGHAFAHTLDPGTRNACLIESGKGLFQ